MLRQLGARAGEEITPVTALCMAVYGNANGMIARKKSAEIPLSSDNVEYVSRSDATKRECADGTRNPKLGKRSWSIKGADSPRRSRG